MMRGVAVAMLLALGGTALLTFLRAPQEPTAPRRSAPDSAAEPAPAPVEALTAERAAAQSAERAAPASGTIEGVVALASAAVPGLTSVRVELIEAINPNASGRAPLRQQQTLRTDRGTPRFAFVGVPFSVYGYRLCVHADGRNGSEAFVAHSAGNPREPVTLTVWPAVDVAVELCDDASEQPVADLDVFLVAADDRARESSEHRARTGADGRAEFTGVLSGRWQVQVGDRETPRAAATIDVPEHAAPTPTRVRVPPGGDLVVLAHGPLRAIGDAGVLLTRIEEVPIRRYRARTAADGRCRLPRLPPGAYVVEVEASGFRAAQRRMQLEPGRTAEIAIELEPD
jgi:hypothetical protein